MGKIYKKAHDMNVVGTVIYSRNNKAYKDVTCDIPYTTSELKEAFIKGAVVDIPAEEYDNAERLVLIPSSFGVSSVEGYGYVNCSIPRVRKNHYHIYPCQENITNIYGWGAYDRILKDNPQYIDQGSTSVSVIADETDGEKSFGMTFGPNTKLTKAMWELRTGPMTISMVVGHNATKTNDSNFSIELNGYKNTFTPLSAYSRQTIYLTINEPMSSYSDLRVCLNNITGKTCNFSIYSIQVEYGLNATEFEPPRDSDWVDVVKSKASADT